MYSMHILMPSSLQFFISFRISIGTNFYNELLAVAVFAEVESVKFKLAISLKTYTSKLLPLISLDFPYSIIFKCFYY